MTWKKVIVRSLSSFLGFVVGLAAAGSFQMLSNAIERNQPATTLEFEQQAITRSEAQQGSGICRGSPVAKVKDVNCAAFVGAKCPVKTLKSDHSAVERLKDRPLKVVSTPRPVYTEEARQQGIEGTVKLRVTFLASGSLGTITVVRGLPHVLTEKAIEAARQIRFGPRIDEGRKTSVTRSVEYTFKISL